MFGLEAPRVCSMRPCEAGPGDDAHADAHLGRAAVACWSMVAALERAGRQLDEHPDDVGFIEALHRPPPHRRRVPHGARVVPASRRSGGDGVRRDVRQTPRRPPPLSAAAPLRGRPRPHRCRRPSSDRSSRLDRLVPAPDTGLVSLRRCHCSSTTAPNSVRSPPGWCAGWRSRVATCSTPLVVAVPTAGVRDWLTRRLAADLGVAANIEMPFPGGFFAKAIGLDETDDPWNVERVTWAVLDVLDSGVVDVPGWPADGEDARSPAGSPSPGGSPTSSIATPPAARRSSSNGKPACAATAPCAPPPSAESAALATSTPLAALPASMEWQYDLWRHVRNRIGSPSRGELVVERVGQLRRGELPARVASDGRAVRGQRPVAQPTRCALGALSRRRRARVAAPSVQRRLVASRADRARPPDGAQSARRHGDTRRRQPPAAEFVGSPEQRDGGDGARAAAAGHGRRRRTNCQRPRRRCSNTSAPTSPLTGRLRRSRPDLMTRAFRSTPVTARSASSRCSAMCSATCSSLIHRCGPTTCS